MACKIGVDKKYRPQPAKCRAKDTYRWYRRNSIKSVWEWRGVGYSWIRIKYCDRKLWSSHYYSDIYFDNYRKAERRLQEKITRASNL